MYLGNGRNLFRLREVIFFFKMHGWYRVQYACTEEYISLQNGFPVVSKTKQGSFQSSGLGTLTLGTARPPSPGGSRLPLDNTSLSPFTFS
jgi:hypothetical protein